MYTEEEMLMLSGIQHYMFCPRQWALIHIEQQWADNRLTTEGELLHTNVDNPFYRQKNGDCITLRSVHVASQRLGLYGITDAIELLPTDEEQDTITHDRYPGRFRPYPVEYKRGHAKPDERDEVQLCAEAICLEEMYGIHIPAAALFYDEVKRREAVPLSHELRTLTERLAGEMHAVFRSGKLPRAEYKRHCRSCSLKDICMPELTEHTKASNYLKRNLYEETA